MFYDTHINEQTQITEQESYAGQPQDKWGSPEIQIPKIGQDYEYHKHNI